MYKVPTILQEERKQKAHKPLSSHHLSVMTELKERYYHIIRALWPTLPKHYDHIIRALWPTPPKHYDHITWALWPTLPKHYDHIIRALWPNHMSVMTKSHERYDHTQQPSW